MTLIPKSLNTPLDAAPPMLPYALGDQLGQVTDQPLAKMPQLDSTPAPKPVYAPDPEQQMIDHDTQKLQKVQWNQDHPWGTAENHPGTWGKIAHVLSVAGNIGGNIVAPNVMANIPGTQANMQAEQGGLAHRLGEETTAQGQNKEREAQTGLVNQEAADEPGKAKSLEDYQSAETKKINDELQNPTLQHLETDQGIFAYNPKTKELTPLTYQGQPLNAAQKQAAEKGREHVNLQDAKHNPYAASYDPNSGKYYDSTGKEIPNPVPYEKPQVTNNNFENREGDKGRALLDKAESSYRIAQQGANGMKAMIDDALQGGKMSARMLPLEGALEITTANGVHRINRTEVDQYSGGGTAFDRLAGQLRGATTGIPFTPEILKSMKHLTDIQEKGAYDTYKGAYDSAKKRYHLSDDEQPLAGPSGGGGAPAGADNEVYVGGKLVGHTVGGKYVALGAK